MRDLFSGDIFKMYKKSYYFGVNMTQACEEKLIADVSEVKALLKEHINSQKEKENDKKDDRSQVPVWIGIGISAIIGFFGPFNGIKP